MEDIFNALLNVRVKTRKGSYLPNKPLMLLVALARCQQGKNRLAPFYIYEKSLGLVYREFGNLNAVFPFGRLPADGIWEIPGDAELHRNKSGDLIRSELITTGVEACLASNFGQFVFVRWVLLPLRPHISRLPKVLERSK